MDEREDFERQNREQQLSLAERIVGHLKWGAHETATEEERGDSVRAARPTRRAFLALTRLVQWRSKLAEAMEDHRCQLIILALLVLDLMFTFGEVRAKIGGVASRGASHTAAHGAATSPPRLQRRRGTCTRRTR